MEILIFHATRIKLKHKYFFSSICAFQQLNTKPSKQVPIHQLVKKKKKYPFFNLSY